VIVPANLEECCRHMLDGSSDMGLCGTIQHHRAGHSRADQGILRYVSQAHADGDALCQSHPREGWIDSGQEFGAIAIILIGNASCDALDPLLQNGAAVHEANPHCRSRPDLRDLGFLEVRIDPVGVAIDQGQGRLALRRVVTRLHVQVRNEAVHSSQHLGSFEIERGNVAGRYRLLVACFGLIRLMARCPRLLL